MTFTSEKIPRIWPFPVSWPEGAPLDCSIQVTLSDDVPIRLGPLKVENLQQLCTAQTLVDAAAIKDDLVYWAVFILESQRDDRWVQEFCFPVGARLSRFPVGIRSSLVANISCHEPGHGYQIRTQNSVYRLLEERDDRRRACIWLNHIGFAGLPIDGLITDAPGPSLQ